MEFTQQMLADCVFPRGTYGRKYRYGARRRALSWGLKEHGNSVLLQKIERTLTRLQCFGLRVH